MVNTKVDGDSAPKIQQNLAAKPTDGRILYMDNLRAIAMLAGILFHAALAYSPLMQNLWLAADKGNSAVVDYLAWFSHLFRMPLFFAIAGFFALMLVEKNGISGFIKHRAKRLLLPFVVFWPLSIAAIMVSVGWAMENVEQASPALQFIKWMSSQPDAAAPPLSTAHLWFIYNLFMFCLLAAAWVKFSPIKLSELTFMQRPVAVLLVLPLLMVPALYSQYAPHAAAEKFYPEWWSFGFNGVFFFLGWLLFRQSSMLDKLDPYRWLLLVVSLLAYTVVFSQLALPENPLQPAPRGWDPMHLLVASLQALVATYMTLACLLFGKRVLNRQNGLGRYLSRASYWIYIIHLPVLFMVQFVLLDVELAMWLKFTISVAVTLAIGMLTYSLLVSWTPIGWLLNGRKKRDNTSNSILTNVNTRASEVN